MSEGERKKRFTNPYEEGSALQHEYSRWSMSCLCTMRESCEVCEPGAYERGLIWKRAALLLAIKSGYQLYTLKKSYYPFSVEWVPVNYTALSATDEEIRVLLEDVEEDDDL